MALFNSRTARRSSSTSYTSTLTTLVFIALCVLGVWMLASNSVVTPPQQITTTRTATAGNTNTDNDLSSSEIPIETTTKTSQDSAETTTKTSKDSVETIPKNIESESAETTTKTSKDTVETIPKNIESLSAETITKIEDGKEVPAYGDNPGHLPDDAIKSDNERPDIDKKDEPKQEQDQNGVQKESAAQISEESLTQKQAMETNQAVSEPEKVQDEDQTRNTAQQQENVQSSLDTGEYKTYEDEVNKQQLREGKAGVSQAQIDHDEQQIDEHEQDETQQQIGEHKQDETLQGFTPETAKQEPQDIAGKNEKQKMQDESQGARKSQTKKEQMAGGQNEKERQKDESDSTESVPGSTWKLCNETAGADYIPCLDNEEAVKKIHSRKHFEHRERHCPVDAPTCLVPLPKGYKTPIKWPNSRDKIWYHNVPHAMLAQMKGHQNWMKKSGELLTFPGGGTQFIHGALHYIDFLQEAEPNIAWGKNTRVILDVGCGVGSFGGFLFDRDVIAMSFAPKDEHEAQVQFALERGIPAISAVMGSQRLQFPGRVFDLVHCARCRVPWHADGGLLLLETNRVLRPGGYFAWSATPVYRTGQEDVEIWNAMSSLTKGMCWELVTVKKDEVNGIGAAIFRKPTTNECYEQREQESPPVCKDDDDPNAAWYVPLQACMHKVPVDKAERGAKWPEAWPQRLEKDPYWLNNSQVGIYGKPAREDFATDTDRWKNLVADMTDIGITWSNVRNVMDMRAVYGGFAAALSDLPVWVFNVVNIDAPDTLPIIFERGLLGIYHDWCESFSTYPRTYDLLHADALFSNLKKRCKLVPVMVEVDRIVRPGGKFIVRDESSTIGEVENLLKSLHWQITYTKEGILCAQKGDWRPDSVDLS